MQPACAASAALQQMHESDSKLAMDGAQHDPFSALQRNISIQTGDAAYVKVIVTVLLRASGHHTNMGKGCEYTVTSSKYFQKEHSKIYNAPSETLLNTTG